MKEEEKYYLGGFRSEALIRRSGLIKEMRYYVGMTPNISMKNNSMYRWIMVFAFLAVSRTTYACRCSELDSLPKNMDPYDLVIKGTLLKIENKVLINKSKDKVSKWKFQRITVKPDSVLHGENLDTVLIDINPINSSCNMAKKDLHVGKIYEIVAQKSGSPNNGKIFTLFRCGLLKESNSSPQL